MACSRPPFTCRRFQRLILIVAAVGFGIVPQARAATPEQVDNAINKAKAYLYAHQKNGTWEEVPTPNPKGGPADVNFGQWGGLTAISTYALLASGDRPSSQPALEAPIKFLMDARITGIYALGLQAQCWYFLPSTPEIRRVLANDGDLLIKALGKKPQDHGLYSYTVAGDTFHNSPSQYGVLGMWALNEAGLEVPTRYWDLIDETWRKYQAPDGGWAYHPKVDPKDNPVKASMTAAGVASLFITQNYLDISGNGTGTDAAIDKGLNWMSEHFKDVRDLYTWYGVERIGTASGYKYFGTIDWFKAGSDLLIKTQKPDGSWDGNFGGVIPSTSFALLFLSRGRAPVVLNKLQYNIDGKPAIWNARRRDGANVSHWLSKQMERDLNWQIVNLEVPVEELHDSQILYLSGSQPLKFKLEEAQKLRTFIEEGGMILGNADNGNIEFANSFKKLGTQLFRDYEFRPLPVNHLIFTGEQYPRTKWGSKPAVLGLSNGVRELMLLVPDADLGKQWQLRNEFVKPEDFQLMSDIFLYTIDKQNLQYKGASYIETPDAKIKATRNIKVARLKYTGNWDPEPGGWRRLAAVMHNHDKVDVDVQTVTLGDGSLIKPAAKPSIKPPNPNAFNVAHMTGTVKFDLTTAQADELKKFVTTGGTLVIDAAGGSSEFATSAEAMLQKVFGSAANSLEEDLKPEDPIFHMAGVDAGPIEYRTFARQVLGHDIHSAHLRGITIGGRLAVIYSREDLSEGLVGEPIDGVVGYSPKVATALMSDALLLGAFGPSAPAASAPTPKPAAAK
jgi:Domain of unknown function (DUF4159)